MMEYAARTSGLTQMGHSNGLARCLNQAGAVFNLCQEDKDIIWCGLGSNRTHS